jgi:hypothetical protein
MTDTTQAGERRNFVLWISIGVPLATIAASALTLYLAYSQAEPELPAQYSWEGAALDADFARAAQARRLGATVDLDLGTDGLAQAQLDFSTGSRAWPRNLDLKLTHATLPALDQTVRLNLDSSGGHYSARLEPLARGHWLVELESGLESGKQWRLRTQFDAPARSVRLVH